MKMKHLNVVTDKLTIGSATEDGSKVIMANNTASDLRPVEADILAAIKAKAELPEDLRDTFELTYITRRDGSHYGVVNWA
jgi:hypothetical protein